MPKNKRPRRDYTHGQVGIGKAKHSDIDDKITPPLRNFQLRPELLLSLAMPRVTAAILANGGSIADLAQILPATAAAMLSLIERH